MEEKEAIEKSKKALRLAEDICLGFETREDAEAFLRGNEKVWKLFASLEEKSEEWKSWSTEARLFEYNPPR